MDNNPFRNHQTTPPIVNNTGYAGQVPQPVNNFGYTSPATGNAYPQQQQQQQQQQQAWQNNTPYSPAQSTTYPSLQSTTYSSLQTPTQSTAYPSLQTPAQSTTYPSLQTSVQTPVQTTPYSSQSTYTPPFQTSSPYNTSLMSSNPPTSGVVGGGNTYQPYQAATPSTPNFQPSPYQQTYPQQQSTYPPPMFGNQQQQYGMGVNQPNNSFYIPDSFGQSNNNMPPPNNNSNMNMNNTQPKHAPVDATVLLKGTQVRRVECPVCQKMIEGDDMAVNHHVNEHYS
ncbi:hypothetical protein EDC94DRAFT_656943 [Helicostylum pulchrum]|nr:hypothetical protein EDC94DRAFT_656943 [Helicostylum pulchrum]